MPIGHMPAPTEQTPHLQVSLLKPALSKVGEEGVRKLEHMLAKRSEAAAASGGSQVAVESIVREDSVWMRKRLLERVRAAEGLGREQLLTGVHEALAARAADPSGGGGGDSGGGGGGGGGSGSNSVGGDGDGDWRVWLADFEWERQCGPCCGIAALRMARSCTAPPHEEKAATATTAEEVEEVEGGVAALTTASEAAAGCGSADSRLLRRLVEVAGEALSVEVLLEDGTTADGETSLLQVHREVGE